jgi:hypothetical protein
VLGAGRLVRHEGGSQAYEAPHGLARALHVRGCVQGGAVWWCAGRGAGGGGVRAGGFGGGGTSRRAGAQGLRYQANDKPKGGEAAGAANEADVERDARGGSQQEEGRGGDGVPHGGGAGGGRSRSRDCCAELVWLNFDLNRHNRNHNHNRPGSSVGRYNMLQTSGGNTEGALQNIAKNRFHEVTAEILNQNQVCSGK